MEDIENILSFVVEIEKLKNVHRKTKPVGLERFENSAEHSWHVCLTAFLLKDFANEEIDINLATLLYFKEELDSAKVLLMDVLRVNPQQLNALNTLSQLYLKEGDVQNSLITIDRAIQLQPSDPYLLNNRGQIYLEMGDLEKGLEDINKSILQDPENLWAYRNKGIYYLLKGNADDAIRLLEKAVSKRELVDEVHSYLGQAYQLKEDMATACEQWKLGLEMKESRSKKLYAENCE